MTGQMHFLAVWAAAAVGVAFWTCLLWPAIVRVFWPWNRDAWGWNMVLKCEMIALALLPGILRLEFGISPGIGLLYVEVVAITLIPVILGWRTWIIWKAQRGGARTRRPDKP